MKVFFRHIVLRISLLLLILGFNGVVLANIDSDFYKSHSKDIQQPQKKSSTTGGVKDQSCESTTFLDDWIKSILFDTPINGESESEEEEELDEDEIHNYNFVFFQNLSNSADQAMYDHEELSPYQVVHHYSLDEPLTPRYLFIQVFRI